MCEASAYMVKDGQEELILESVDTLENEEGEIFMVNIFGEQKTLRARLTRYNSQEGKIVFEAV